MNLELTISGLVVIALEANGDKPDHPKAIDIIVPNAHGHTCRLNYLPGEVQHAAGHKELPDMVIDEVGTRIASFTLQDRVLEFALDKNPVNDHTVRWGPDAEKPPTKADEEWLNWIPKLGDLGFSKFKAGAADTLPPNARARIRLPPGTLFGRNPILDKFSKDYIVWTFPGANNLKRILTNEVVLTASGEKLSIREKGNEILTSTRAKNETLRMCISHETTVVPLDYADPAKILAHLSHFDVLTGDAKAAFQEPVVSAMARTGRPACMGVVLVHDGS